MLLITGPKTILKLIEMKQLDQLYRWINDRELRRLSSFYDPITKENHKKWLSAMIASKHNRVFGVFTKNKQLIGTTGLYDIHWINKNSELRIRIGDRKFLGKGYGTEAVHLILDFAFNDLGLHRVWLTVFNDNLPAIAVYKKCGFKIEGHLKDGGFIDGKWVNLILMAKINPND